jgi:hypothetical protein
MKKRPKTRRTSPAAALSAVFDCGLRSVAERGEAIHRFCSVTAGRQALPESLKLYLVNIAIEKLDPQGFRNFFGVRD